jgi:hypothetical protein
MTALHMFLQAAVLPKARLIMLLLCIQEQLYRQLIAHTQRLLCSSSAKHPQPASLLRCTADTSTYPRAGLAQGRCMGHLTAWGRRQLLLYMCVIWGTDVLALLLRRGSAACIKSCPVADHSLHGMAPSTSPWMNRCIALYSLCSEVTALCSILAGKLLQAGRSTNGGVHC